MTTPMNACRFCGSPTTHDSCRSCFKYKKILRNLPTKDIFEISKFPPLDMESHHFEIIKDVLLERGIRERGW